MLKDWLTKLEKLSNLISVKSAVDAVVYTLAKPLDEATWRKDGTRRKGISRLAALAHTLIPTLIQKNQNWKTPGQIKSIFITERGGRFSTENGWLEIDFLGSDIVKVQYSDSTPPPEHYSFAVIKPVDAWTCPEITHIQLADAFIFVTKDLTVLVHLTETQIIIADAQGTPLRVDVDMASAPDGSIRHRTALDASERIYGLGERATALNRRGYTHILWNTDPKGYQTGDDPLYLNIPLYVSMQEKGGRIASSYLVFYDNTTYATFDLGETAHNSARHQFSGGDLCYYFIAGSLPDLMTCYTELTGRHPLAPLWMLGYHQSRWTYDSEKRLRTLAGDFLKHNVPCDAFYLDIDMMDNYKVFTCDKQRFPDLPGLAEDLLNQGRKLVAIVDPGIKKDNTFNLYRSGLKHHFYCTKPDRHVYYAPVWGGQCAFPDFTLTAVRAWWGAQFQYLIDKGVTGFWIDMNEPAAFLMFGDPSLPGIVRHSLEGRGGTHDEAHNVYGLLMAQATHEGLRMLQESKRPVVITRSGWAGIQRYATSWTGDNQSTWSSMELTIPMIINLGLSGVGFTGADVGGFIGEPDGELFTRWIQMAVFMPFFRSHTAKGYPDQEPWTYGEPFLSIIRRFIELRYELLPYLYTAVWQMHKLGWPVVRPIWWDGDSAPVLHEIDDAYLCGDKLLVAPVTLPNATERDVTLPTGTWYDFWSNKDYNGSSTVHAYAPLETIPLYVRAGTILSLGEIGASVEQRADKFLRLSLYPLLHPGSSTTHLYEDSGDGFAYQNGEYCHSIFTMHRQGEGLTVTWLRYGEYIPPYEHIELTLNGVKRIPLSIRADGVPVRIVAADQVRQTVLAGIPIFDLLEIQL